MLMILGLALTIFIAFTRYNLQLGRAASEGLTPLVKPVRPTAEAREEPGHPPVPISEPAPARRGMRPAATEQGGASLAPVRGGTLRSTSALPTTGAPGSEQRSVAAE